MGVFEFDSDVHSRNRDAFKQVHGGDGDQNPANWSQEVVAGAAAFSAMHEFEKKQEEEGYQVNHEFGKELVAGFAGAELDRLVESQGLDFVDRETAVRYAREQAQQLYDQQYGGLEEGGSYN